MLVIIKPPGEAPFTRDIAGNYESLRNALGAEPGACITNPGIRVWCDDDYMRKDPLPPLNLIRPSDGHPIHGTVVCVGEDGPDTVALDDRQCALWLATLALIGVDETDTWRIAALNKLARGVQDVDAGMFEQLRARVAFRDHRYGAPWPRRRA